MLIPATVVLSKEEATIEVMDVDEGEATFLYAMCETCGWDSRREPTGAALVFEGSVALLDGVMLYQPL